MELVERIRTLAGEKGLTIAELERKLEFGNNIIAKWDKSIPRSDKLERLADYFNVSVDYLLGRTDNKASFPENYFYCCLCGIGYDTKNIKDKIRHDNYHNNYLLACEKFGPILGDIQSREYMKKNAYTVLNSKDAPLDEQCNAFVRLSACWFSSSIQLNDWSLEHVELDTYIAMLLHQSHVKEQLPEEVYKWAVNAYGTQEGLENGSTFYQVPVSQNETERLLECYEQLDEHGKEVVKTIMELELKRIQDYMR